MSHDDDLRDRLREKIGQKAEPDDDSTDTESEMDGHDNDDEDDEDDDMEMDMADDMKEAAQMIAEASAEDVSPEQVMEMLQPLFDGEDTRDDPAELAGDEVDIETIKAEARDAAAEAAEAVVAEALPDGEVATESDLDAKLDDVVEALADETREVIQQADVASTPTPSATGGDAQTTTSDLFSDGGDDE